MPGGNLVRNQRYRKTPRTPRSAHARYYYSRSLVVGTPIRRPKTPSRCQSAPKVMDSHSRSASPRDPIRPQHRPPSPPSSPTAFDNRAYQHDESDPNHNDSFTSNGPHQNGHSKEPNGDKTLEAVNLELINLTPKNGAKKKDVEVDMNATNPYDEYFVPVNEHRKYMRGEKLYVTADKRGEKGGCKRPLCWTLLGLVVVAIVALIVLAATGILFTNSPTPLEQYNASVSSARAFGGITSDHSHHLHDHTDHDHSTLDHSHDFTDNDHHHESKPTTLSTPQYVTETLNDDAHDPSIMSDESSDMSMYVPRTVEGELKIDNEVFVPAFEDIDSEEYREFTTKFSEALKQALFDRNSIENGDNEIMVEVVRIRNGSVIVTYRIHWIPKHNSEPSEELLTEKTLKTNLNNYLNTNNRMISIYHVADEDVQTKPVLDLCKINNNDCEHKCEFDDSILDFICVCPYGQITDVTSPKMCIPVLDNSESRSNHPETTTQEEMKTITFDSNGNTMRTISEEEKPNTETVNVANNKNTFDWKEGRHYTPETTTEKEQDLNFSHIFGRTDTETPKPEPEPEPEPSSEEERNLTVVPQTSIESEEPRAEPTAEPKSESEITEKAQPEPQPAAEPKPEPEPELTAEPKAEPEPEPTSEQKSEPEPEPTAEPKPEPASEPTVESKAEPEPIPTMYTNSEPEPEPTAEPVPEPEPKPESKPTETEPKMEMENISKDIYPSYPITELQYESESVNNSNIASDENLKTIHQQPEKANDNPDLKLWTTEESFMDDIGHKQNEPTESITTPKPFDHPTFNLDNIIGLQTTSEPNEIQTANDDKKSESKSESNKYIENNMGVATTTMRISISEPHIINEPSYEPNPTIISILKENEEQINANNIYSHTESAFQDDWLEAEENSTTVAPANEQLNINDLMKTQMESEGSDERVTKTEPRSSKTLDDFIMETTTSKPHENMNDDITFDLIRKQNEMPLESTTIQINIDQGDSTTFNPLEIDENDSEDTTTQNKMESTTSSQIFTNKINDKNDYDNISNLNQNIMDINTVNNTQSSNENKNIATSPTQEAQTISLNENQQESSTVEIDGKYSLQEQNEDSEAEKKLMEALDKTTVSNIVSKGSSSENETTDVTFDTINMLYNRSSKTIPDEKIEIQDVTESMEKLKLTDSETTTDSDFDWLSETVTEVNYNDLIKTMKKNDEATETPAAKVDEILGRGINKDDFEPDYLSNMGSSTSKMSDQDEILYGMSHDYENDDSRVKRVNVQKEQYTGNSAENITDNSLSAAKSGTIETTTMGQFIYEMAKTNSNATIINKENSVITNNPAPVWEETESEPTIHEVSNTEMLEVKPINSYINIVTSTAIPTTTVFFNYNNQQNINQENLPNINAMNDQNTTQVNNLNVTIYEIASPNYNQSLITSKPTNVQSSEIEDHETDMNPFLPEVENNKSLVKKLQEGHDINETQNENAEDHTINNANVLSINESSPSINNASQLKETYSNELLVIPDSAREITTAKPDDNYNQLFTNSISRDVVATTTETNSAPIISDTSISEGKTSETSSNEQVLPISTFLLDTDDLDTKRPTTLSDETRNEGTSEKTNVDSEKDDNGFLSVVPIEPENEQLKKSYNSERIQELNFISDSPKKSDRRTDVSNFDSVINNEA